MKNVRCPICDSELEYSAYSSKRLSYKNEGIARKLTLDEMKDIDNHSITKDSSIDISCSVYGCPFDVSCEFDDMGEFVSVFDSFVNHGKYEKGSFNPNKEAMEELASYVWKVLS